jgi:hypothetical protein
MIRTEAKELTRTASYEMHGSWTRDVHITQSVEEAVVTPCPTRRYAVHYRVEEREDTIRLEVTPAGNPTNIRSNIKDSIHNPPFGTTSAAVLSLW